MGAGFELTGGVDSITVATEAFTLVFSKYHVGIASFRYETSGTWHECVESRTTPPTLFGPYFGAPTLQGGVLYPDGGTVLELEVWTPWYVQIRQNGNLRNDSIPNCTDYPVQIRWSLWPSGRLACRIEADNLSGSALLLAEEAYRLNPADDPDINLGRDSAPNLAWFGFYSNNTGSGEQDLSHDAIVVPFQVGLDQYATDDNTNRIYRANVAWPDEDQIARDFLVTLSVNGSWGDCADATGFQSRGDDLSSDFQNPDPLDGSSNAGDVVTGTMVGDGFDESRDGYTVETE